MCGVVAALIGRSAAVNLRNPPPLSKPLQVKRLEGGAVILLDGEIAIAEGAPISVEVEVPNPVSLSEAEASAKLYPGFANHLFPRCFGCGPQRAEGDGLRIFPGPVAGRDILAAPWTPDASFADEDGRVRPEFVWAATDCPGAWTLIVHSPQDSKERMVTAQIAAAIIQPVERAERYVVIAWPIGSEGRRTYAGTALFSRDGKLCAVAKATWVLSTWGVPMGLAHFGA